MIEWLKDLTIRKYYILKLINDKDKGYLYQSGWIKSFKTKSPVSLNGEARPWLSIPANQLIDERIDKRFKIFEFGSGNSTIYFDSRVALVRAIEHDKAWYEQIKKAELKNTDLIYCALNNGYSDYILQVDDLYDIISIDGRERVKCFINAIKALKKEGIIIFDDSDREKYKEIYQIARDNNFKQLQLWGLGLGSIRKKCTTIFYRKENCLKI